VTNKWVYGKGNYCGNNESFEGEIIETPNEKRSNPYLIEDDEVNEVIGNKKIK